MKRTKRELTEGDFELMCLPKEFWVASWSFLSDSKVKQKVFNYLNSLNIDHQVAKDGDGLLIAGEHGTGKTYISAICAKAFRKYEYSVYFVSAAHLQDGAEQGIEFDEGEGMLDRAKNVDVLIIDDLGMEAVSPLKKNNYVVDVISHRKNWKKVLIVTTCKEPEALAVMYGKHVMDMMKSFMFGLRVEGIFYGDKKKQLDSKYA